MEIVVIGAGASGLFSSLALARYGVNVTLIEAGSRVAPLLRGFSRAGHQFDVGFHVGGLLGASGPLRRYLSFAGVLEHVTLLPQSPEGRLFRFLSQDAPADISLSGGLRGVAQQLSELWPKYASQIAAFWDAVENAFIASPFMRPETLAARSLDTSHGDGCSAWPAAMRLPPRLASLLTSCAVYYGVPPGRAVFEELALVTYAMTEGVHSIAGGGASLAVAYEKALANAGIRPRLGTTASAIVLDGDGKLAGVRMGTGEIVACEGCIYTGHPSFLPRMLPHGVLRPRISKHLETLEETASVFMLFGITENAFLSNREMFLCGTDILDEAFAEGPLQSGWIHIACGGKSPRGEYPVTVCCRVSESSSGCQLPKGVRPPGYAVWKNEMAGAVAHHIRRHVPELSDLRIVDSASQYTMRDWVYGSRGSIYGVMHSTSALPVLPSTRIKGLFLAGQNIILPGLLGATISGAVAAGGIIGFPLLFEGLACADAE